MKSTCYASSVSRGREFPRAVDVTRISRGKIRLQREKVDVTELVRRVVEDHRSSFTAANLALHVAIPQGPIHIDADRTRIAQAVGNLLQNAAKFTSGGTIDRSRGGLGLGLALVKGLVELHHGQVHVSSDGPGKGAEPRAFRADPVLCGAVLVALSGYALEEDRRRATEAGFHRHLAKPASPEMIERVFAELAVDSFSG